MKYEIKGQMEDQEKKLVVGLELNRHGEIVMTGKDTGGFAWSILKLTVNGTLYRCSGLSSECTGLQTVDDNRIGLEG